MNSCSPITVNQLSSCINAGETNNPTVVDPITGLTLKCPDNSVTCTSTEKCSVCRVGYSFNEATCKCVYCNGCFTCNATEVDVCYLCFAPEVLNRTSSKCVLPQCTTPHCIQCDINGICIKCMLNYEFINNTCQKCSSAECRSCSVAVETCDANSCILGYVYYLNQSTGKGFSQPCAFGCNVCLASNLSACSSCSTGYYPQVDNSGVSRCVTWFTNSKICISASECTIVWTVIKATQKNVYHVMQAVPLILTQTNVQLIFHAIQLQPVYSVSSSRSTCAYCVDGFYLKNDACI